MNMWRHLWVLACCALMGCFVGYDSRWGEGARSQKAVAEEETPGELQGTPDEGPKRKVKVRKIRAYASTDYGAQVSDVQKQIERVVDHANEVLEPTLSLRLELDDVRSWPVPTGDLLQMLEVLEQHDAGDDVAWVVGFIGRLPGVETNFTVLGRARMHGHHFVVRAMNDAAEYDAIAKNLDELDEAKRSALYKSRLQHKETAVFLHELGHTLGVPHELARETLMNGVYDSDSESYSEHASALMRLTLAQRLHPKKTTPQALARSLVDYVKKTPDNWVPDDRDEWLAALEPAATVPKPKGEGGAPERFDPARWRALEQSDRVAYLLAIEHERAGGFEEAWNAAAALFDAHPDVYEIQDLRCRLATRKGGAVEEMLRNCEDFNRLDAAMR